MDDHHYKAAHIDALLLFLAGAIAVLQFGALPLLMPLGWPAEAAFVLLCAATAPLHYGLMHETMHGTLLRSEAWNARIGRLLGITFGYSWHVIRFGHLAHHGFNRHGYDRPDVLSGGSSRMRALPLYIFNLLGGQALLYVAMALPLLLPTSTTRWVIYTFDRNPGTASLREAALRAFTHRERRRAIRFDILAIVALFAFAAWCWGPAWPVFAATIAARWCVVSLLDNAPHYGTGLDAGLAARNTYMPRGLGWLVMNQNLHGTHHHAPQISWHALPARFAQSGARHDGGWLAAILRQFRGPRRAEDFR